MDDDSVFLVDVRDVVQRMHDKGYTTLGEAFDDLFHDGYRLSADEKRVELADF